MILDIDQLGYAISLEWRTAQKRNDVGSWMRVYHYIGGIKNAVIHLSDDVRETDEALDYLSMLSSIAINRF